MNFKYILLTSLFFVQGCGKGFKGDPQVKREENNYQLDILSEFAEEKEEGVFYIKDNSEIFLEDKDSTIHAKEIHFGEGVKILGHSEEAICGQNGKNSGSLKVFAEVITGSPFVELLGQPSSFCSDKVPNGNYLNFLEAKPLNAGRSGYLYVHEDADINEFSVNLSDVVEEGSKSINLRYKKRTKSISKGADSGVTNYCVSKEESECIDSIKPFVNKNILKEIVISKSMDLKKNHRIVSDTITFKEGVTFKLNSFHLLVEATKIIFEPNVKFQGFPIGSKQSCGRDGTNSGSLFMMAKDLEGTFEVNLLGMSGGNGCSTSQRIGHCNNMSPATTKLLNSKRAYKGGHSGFLYLLEGSKDATIIFRSMRSSGSNPYNFKLWANHHYGAFGSNSCNWSRIKKNPAGRVGNVGSIKYLEEGPGW